jgi:GNAT superfamily N-acetyltransferase
MAALELPDVSLAMVREGLEDLPVFELPPGYSIRSHREGDQAVWTDIHLAAEKRIEVTAGLFADEFGGDAEQLRRRQLFLCDPGGAAVGTGTAWHGRYRGTEMGRVHWMAVVPGQQGRGLSRPLLAAVCSRLRELGHRRAFLTTSTGRLAALRLYLRFGFRADPTDEPQRAAWEAVRRRLGCMGVAV